MTAELRDFARQRWSLVHAILADPDISCGAKNVATALLTRFAHASTGRCRIRDADVAQATAMKQDTIYRHLRQLAEAGYVVELERVRGGGLYGFLSQAKSAENVHHMNAEPGCTSGSASGSDAAARHRNPDERPANPDAHPEPPTPPYKDTSKISKKGQPERPNGSLSVRVERGSGAEEGWNAWLRQRGYPSLDELGIRWPGDPSAFDLPFRYPPGEHCPEWQHRTAEARIERFLTSDPQSLQRIA
jgi:DNA-binding transcriptional ArsR family regulator